jgi:26S proteasome regulatory subunit N8
MPPTLGEAVPSTTVSIAPLILLSACDHYIRSAKGTKKRVVGVLLGQNTGNNVRVTNSFAGMDVVAIIILIVDGILTLC